MVSPTELRLRRQMARAVKDFDMVRPGDKVMVAVSGGKDSLVMLRLFAQMQKRVPFDFRFVAVNLDQGQPGFQPEVLEKHFVESGVPYKMLMQDTYSVVTDKTPAGKTYCSLCSRMRRGVLYRAAIEMGCTRIALGHHRDDFIETLLLNVFYSGQLKAMAPVLVSDDRQNTVIRPLVYCDEEGIAALAEELKLPILPCDLCGSQENLKRQEIKALIASLHEANPKVKGNMLAALKNVRPTHLMDKSLLRTDELDLLSPGSSQASRPASPHPPPSLSQ
jgi:tRNA 2-thiocytidine biosynthesis protein TtcA